jgi:hypothetical protein
VSEIGDNSDMFDLILGLDPRIHNPLKSMDARVKPEYDGGSIARKIFRDVAVVDDCIVACVTGG